MELDTKSAEQLRKSFNRLSSQKQQAKTFIQRVDQTIGKEHFAYFLVALSQVMWPLGFIYSNQNNLSPFQTALVRGIVVTFVSFGLSRVLGIDAEFNNLDNFKTLMARNSFIVVEGIMYALAQFYIQQPILQTLHSTGPLFVFILDYKMNGVVITRQQFIGVMLGIIGVLITVNGEMIILTFDPQYTSTTTFENYQTTDPLVQLLMAIALTSAKCGWAYAQTITKRLQGVNTMQINMHLSILIMFSTGIMYPMQVQQPVEPTTIVMAIFLGGIPMACAQFFFITAVTMTRNTGVLSMFIFVSVITGYLISILRYGEEINPICSLGTVLIAFGLGKILLKESKPQQVENKQEKLKHKKVIK